MGSHSHSTPEWEFPPPPILSHVHPPLCSAGSPGILLLHCIKRRCARWGQCEWLVTWGGDGEHGLSTEGTASGRGRALCAAPAPLGGGEEGGGAQACSCSCVCARVHSREYVCVRVRYVCDVRYVCVCADASVSAARLAAARLAATSVSPHPQPRRRPPASVSPARLAATRLAAASASAASIAATAVAIGTAASVSAPRARAPAAPLKLSPPARADTAEHVEHRARRRRAHLLLAL